jgi:hypothetical protein
MQSALELTTIIIISTFLVFAYVLGFYLCMKIIMVSLKDKEGISWKLDIANATCLIIHFTHIVFMHGITYLISDLYIYTGKWICYGSKLLTYFGNFHIASHSFFIALLKCLIITKWETARSIGHCKLAKIVLWVDLLLYTSLSFLVRLLSKPDFFWEYKGFSYVERCLGDPDDNWGLNSTKEVYHPGSGHCWISDATSSESKIEYAIYVVRLLICYAQILFVGLITLNIFEIGLYYKIFSFARR